MARKNTRFSFRQLLCMLAVAAAAVLGMTILSAHFPLSVLYDRLERSGLECLGIGLNAGVAALCTILYSRSLAKSTSAPPSEETDEA